MPRLAELKDVMFEVGTRPLFARVGGRDVQARDNQAIVELPSGRVISVVGRGYRLVSHAEALGLAYDCARTAFPETKAAEWAVALVDAPSTGGTCFIDLAHNSAALDFSGLAANDKPEVYGPFLRVTNSYNRTRALSFDIGYYRKVCKNGLILRDSVIHFKMNHQRREIGEAVRFEASPEKLDRQRKDFLAFMGKLQECAVPEPLISGFAQAVLGFHSPGSAVARDDSRWVAWHGLAKTVDEKSTRYASELGPNAYAVLNVVTDLASHPPECPAVRRDRNALQRRAGKWASDFAAVCGSKPFDVSAYLESLAGAERDAGRLDEAMPHLRHGGQTT